MNVFQKFLLFVAKPFYGKGYVDKYFPSLIGLFKVVYSSSGDVKEVQVDIPLNLKLIVKSDDIGVGIPLISKGVYEPLQTKLFLETLKAGDVFFDVGANIGYYSILASSKIGNTGKVYSFEPDIHNVQILEKNIELNNASNVKITKKAVSDKTGFVNFKSSALSKGDSAISISNSEGNISIPSITLDDFVAETGVYPNVIKIDVEGAEIMALKGAKGLFSRAKQPIVLFIEYNPQSLRQVSQADPLYLLNILEESGFKIKYILDEKADSLIEYSKEAIKGVMKNSTFCNFFVVLK